MKNKKYVVPSSLLGLFGGGTAYVFGLKGAEAAGVLAGAGLGAKLLSVTPFLVGLLPTLRIARQINEKYENDPLKLVSAHFLLSASYVVLSSVLQLAIMAAFVSVLTPFNLPILITAGVASASIMLGLYLLTRPEGAKPLTSCCAFFRNCLPRPSRNGTEMLSTDTSSDPRQQVLLTQPTIAKGGRGPAAPENREEYTGYTATT